MGDGPAKMETKMNKKQLSARLAKESGISQARASSILNVLFDGETGIIPGELVVGGKVTIPGFGTFSVKTRAARIGTNPADGVRIQIPAKRKTYFRAGKALKARIG